MITDTLDYFISFLLNGGTLTFSIYYILTNFKKLSRARFTYVLLMHLGNCLIQILTLGYVFSVEYEDLVLHRERLGFLIAIISSLVVFKINWLDIGILEAFSLLQKEEKLMRNCRLLKKVLIGLFVVTNVPSILLRVMTLSQQFKELGDATRIFIYAETGIWLLFGITYENIQAVYLFHMAHTEKIAKTEYAKQLQLQVRLNIFICLVDWVGMFMHAFTVFYESRHNTLIHAISTALVGCHTHLICHVYMGMMVLVRQSPVVKRESEVRLEPIIQSLELEPGLGLEFVQ